MKANINLKFRGIESTLYYDDIGEDEKPNRYFGYISIMNDRFRMTFIGNTMEEAISDFENVVNRHLDFGEIVENVSSGEY